MYLCQVQKKTRSLLALYLSFSNPVLRLLPLSCRDQQRFVPLKLFHKLCLKNFMLITGI